MSDASVHSAPAGIPHAVSDLRSLDLLGQLYRTRRVPETHVAAGRHFQLMARQAGLSPRLASDPRGRGDARQRLSSALDALGGPTSPVGSVALEVIGQGRALEDWARAHGFAPGRPVATGVAQGLLEGALEILAGHFGYAAERRRASA
ncbi:hypothetical protein [Zavarzinia sp. CC-PAN008]|uniref:hypothetical protein n=1 Tax=Zavarzinia sp. CC-PAN008 TaxID=3243332 RepID=UPI003F749375